MPNSHITNTQDAIDPSKNIAVFASAGTGKTHLLVHRILKLLLNNVDSSHILAITFTRKAAAEMRERLMKILADWAGFDDQQLKLALQELSHPSNPNSISKARKLYEQLLFSDYEIRITTFHAFCQDILKRFALHTDVPAGFHLIENTDELKQEARERLFNKALQGDDKALINALYELLKHGSTVNNVSAMLDTFIDSRGDWWSFTETQDDPIDYANTRLKQYLFADNASDETDNSFSQLSVKLQEYLPLLTLHKTKPNQKYSDIISKHLENENNSNNSIEQLTKVFFKTDLEPKLIKQSKTLEKSFGAERLVLFIQLHEEIISILSELLDAEKRDMLVKFNQAWFYAGSLLLHEFQNLKFSRNALDFNDLEWHTYLLLNEQDDTSWIQYKLDQRIDHILIDEFQDTNPTQWNLLFPLLEELAANLHQSNKSLFFVGDSKQSIYGFRRANPKLQYIASEWAKQNLNAEQLEMDRSFRSSPAIIDFVNDVFNKNNGQPLIEKYRNHKAAQDELWGSVEIDPLITCESKIENHDTFRNPLLQAKKNSEIDSHYHEGQYIAGKIDKLIRNCTPIAENNQQRSLCYSDIIILTRSRTHTPQLERALREQHIPYLTVSENDFLKQLEVQDILALLTYLIQPHNDLALAQVLRSPCFGISDEDLMELAINDADNWHEKLRMHVNTTTTSLLTSALSKLQHWRDIADRIPVHDLLDRIYFENNILSRYANSCTPTKKNQVLANLTHILQLALDIDAGRYSSIQSFLSALQKPGASDNYTNNINFNHGNENTVQIMTIHSAKGLEAPVVFLVDTGSSPPKQRAYQSVIHWPDNAKHPEQFFIIGKKESIDKKTQLRLKQQLNENWQEELNLLYVAITRAKQYLFISGVQPKNNQDNCWHSIIAEALPDGPGSLENGAWTHKHGSPPIIKARPPNKTPKEIDLAFNLDKPFANTTRQDSYSQENQEPDSQAIQHGTLVHKLFELTTSDSKQDLTKLHTKVSVLLGQEIDQELFNTATEEVQQCLDSSELKELFEPKSANEVINEVPVCYCENQEYCYRILDRLIISDELIWIIDFKTSSDVSENTMQQQAMHYRKQMSNYYFAIRKMYPNKEIRTSILFTSLPALYDFEKNELSID